MKIIHRAATLMTHPHLLTNYTGRVSLLSTDIETKTYKVCGNKSLENTISVSSERKELIIQIESLQDSFFEKFKEYKREDSLHPKSKLSKRLFAECESLHARSQSLVDLL